MKLSKNSKQLMLFFTKNKYINKVNQTRRTNNIVKDLYHNILESYNYLNTIKKEGNYFNLSIKKIQSSRQISKPQNFNANSFPEIVRKHIDTLSMSELTYTFSLFGRKITTHFVVEEDNVEHNIDTYNGYIDSKLEVGCIDIGNFAVKSDLLRKVGFPFREYAADWKLVETLIPIIKERKKSIIKIPETLYVHN